MFPDRYFATRYFNERYFDKGSESPMMDIGTKVSSSKIAMFYVNRVKRIFSILSGVLL